MSWQDYVDSNLMGSGIISRAAIVGQKGGIWGTSDSYSLSAQELEQVISAFNDINKIHASGVRLQGQKFFTLSANSRSIYAKKGADGALLVKTNQAILVAEYTTPTQHPEAAKVVEGLADYLISVGF